VPIFSIVFKSTTTFSFRPSLIYFHLAFLIPLLPIIPLRDLTTVPFQKLFLHPNSSPPPPHKRLKSCASLTFISRMQFRRLLRRQHGTIPPPPTRTNFVDILITSLGYTFPIKNVLIKRGHEATCSECKWREQGGRRCILSSIYCRIRGGVPCNYSQQDRD
jgi:hypothetical protein